jgi:hypothetical protein
MKRAWPAFLGPLALAGCGRLERLVTDVTPEQWLAAHPHLPVRVGQAAFILCEPSSTVFVYALGVVLAVAGFLVLRKRGTGRSRLLWGIAFLVWAAATFSAGTSYQAFAWQIKGAGRELFLWTSWWEIAYLILFVASMNLIAAAVSVSSASGKARRRLVAYASANTAAYLCAVLVGALAPLRFLASFECMLLFVAPTFILLFVVNAARYAATRRRLELGLVVSWLLLLAVVVAYFAYYLSGRAEALWAKGVWFNANDVLHIGLILWVLHFLVFVAGKLEDGA